MKKKFLFLEATGWNGDPFEFQPLTMMKHLHTKSAILAVTTLILTLTLYFFFPDIKRIYTAYSMGKLPPEMYKKIWVHRVNSLEKVKEAAPIFSGVELDIVFDTKRGVFDINHPPQESINLTLYEYIASVEDSRLSYWLDLKYFKKSYNDIAIKRLMEIIDTYHLQKEKFIIESYSPWVLTDFSHAGFKTSYYIAPRLLKKLSSTPIESYGKEENASLKKLNRQIQKGKFTHISFHSKYLNFVQNHLNDSKKLLLWNQKYEFFSPLEKNKIIEIIEQDERIEVLLIKLDSKFTR